MNAGVQSNTPVPSPLSTKVAPIGRSVAVKRGKVLSASVAEIPKLRFAPSRTVCCPMVASIGFWLPASVTVMVTISESLRKPSLA